MQAKTHYEKDGSEWGLGLTYHLMGKSYYEKAMNCFMQIDHYRGIYMCDNSEKYKTMFE